MQGRRWSIVSGWLVMAWLMAGTGQAAAPASLTTPTSAPTPLATATAQPIQTPPPTPPPPVTLWSVLTPRRCLVLGLVGMVVFVISYGLQIALFCRRQR